MILEKERKKFCILIFYIKNTGHNTFISIFKKERFLLNREIKYNLKLLKVYSCGSLGFKHKKKETPFASSLVANRSALYAIKYGATHIHIIFKGVSILKKIILTIIIKTCLKDNYLKILSINDISYLSHNGCRVKKIKKR